MTRRMLGVSDEQRIRAGLVSRCIAVAMVLVAATGCSTPSGGDAAPTAVAPASAGPSGADAAPIEDPPPKVEPPPTEPAGDPPAADTCEGVHERFTERLAEAEGRCHTARDCGCYSELPFDNRQAVTDATSARALRTLAASYHRMRCPLVSVQTAAPTPCEPRCVDGRCTP